MINKDDIELNKTAKEIVNQLSVVLRTSQIHDPNNVAVTSVIDKMIVMINSLIAVERVIALELKGDFFYVNDARIRFALEYLLNFDFLVREFKKRELGSVIFKDKLRPDDIKTFIAAFIASGFSSSPFDLISEKVFDLNSLSVERLKKNIVESGSVEPRKMVKKTYFNAVSYTKGVINKIKSGEKVNIKKAKRVIETMVDQILEQEQLLIGMTAIKDYDEYTYHHSVNVSILSIALAQRLGLNKKLLTELGIVAIFHDIGKMEIPNEILNKPSNFSDDEWKLIRKHPMWGVRALLKLRKLDELTIKSAIVSFEHHLNYDHTGYPRVKKKSGIDFLSRIISLADQYDAMTSSRVYSRIPMSPDKALSLMVERSGTQLDPLLMKFFVNMVGIFPVGTLVMLNTRELGLVYESNQLFGARPRVMLIIDKEGKRTQGNVVDLTEKNDQGEYLRTILKTMDPNKYRINLAEYLL
ncbi:MAG: HD-GYP domain-containing protein [Nitrospirae bacterium]|nr:HD-GYP domain-containing protein [Nitrospirota bacterium]